MTDFQNSLGSDMTPASGNSVRDGMLRAADICDETGKRLSLGAGYACKIAAEAIRTAADALPQDGVVVPREPTEEMIRALTQEWHPKHQGNIRERYAAMLRAAQEVK